MHPLGILRQELLSDSDPADTLRLADKYLSQFEDMGDSFILPFENRRLKPILDYYYRDLPGWLLFVQSIRDSFERSSRQKNDVQEFYRTLVLRQVQTERRKRINSAVDMALKMGKISNDTRSKNLYRQKCIYEWGNERDAVLNAHRNLVKGKRLSLDEQQLLLNNFWAGIDARIENGDIPAP